MTLCRALLRLLALLGPLAIVAWEAAALPSLQPRQDWGFFLLAAAVLAALGFLAAITPRALGVIVRHPDLLVPLGVTLTLVRGVDWLAALPLLAPLAAPLWQGTVLYRSLALSLPLVLTLLLAVVQAGWTTVLLLQVVERGRVDLLAPLVYPGQWLPRTLAALTIGTVGFLLLACLGLAVTAVALPVGMLLIAAASLGWNLATAALLPATLRSTESFGEALGEGFRESWQHVGRWWGVVVLQMLLLGWVTFLSLSYTISEPGWTSSRETTKWSVNGFWTGGYEDGCRWYDQLLDVAQTTALPPVVTLLALLLGTVAVAVKLTVASRLDWRPTAVEERQAVRQKSIPAYAAGLVLAIVAIAFIVALFCGLLFREQLSEALAARQFRRAVEQGEPPDKLTALLAQRDDNLKLAAQLSQDPDPRVRRALVGYLVQGATPAHYRDRRFGSYAESWSGFNGNAIPILERLLNDPDADVRRAALQAAEKQSAGELHRPLLGLLRSGALVERVAVAESLAHWNAAVFLETFADRAQPREVRLALVRGAERYGWERVARDNALFQQTMQQCLDDPDREVRAAAIAALSHADGGPALWLGVLRRGSAEDRSLAFAAWAAALVDEPAYPGENYPLLEATENLLFHSGNPVEKPGQPPGKAELDGEPIVLVLHVLCAAARTTTGRLDQSPRTNLAQALRDREQGSGPAMAAFAEELHRLQLLLRALAGVRLFAADARSARTTFTLRLPDEPAGDAAPRELRAFLLQDLREPLSWSRRHGRGYASPFLRVNGFWFHDAVPEAQAGRARTLGQVLEALRLDTDEALQQYLKEQDALAGPED